MENPYKYLGYFMLLLIPLTFAGFYKTYFVLIPNFNANINFWHHFHGAVASLWIGMLIAQPFLIQNKRPELHRMLGKCSYVLFPFLIFTTLMLIVKRGFLTVSPVSDAILMIVFYTLGIINRKNQAKHMRYMIVTALVLVDPTLGRILVDAFPAHANLFFHIEFLILYGILLALIVYDRQHKRNYTPYLIALAGFACYQIAFDIIKFWS
jgi:uncharacterized membrane protein YeiH